MRTPLITALLISCASAKPIPESPPERAVYFAQAVRDAVAAKERAKQIASAAESAADEALRQACSQVVALRGFLPAGQRIDDVDAACKGYISTEPPAPVVPKVEPKAPVEPVEPVADGGVPA